MSALIEFVGQRFARFVVFVILFYHIKLSYGRSARNHYKTVLKCLLTKTIINEEGNNLIGFIFWLIGKYFIWHQNEMFSFTLENWKRNQWKTIIQFLNMRGKNMSLTVSQSLSPQTATKAYYHRQRPSVWSLWTGVMLTLLFWRKFLLSSLAVALLSLRSRVLLSVISLG